MKFLFLVLVFSMSALAANQLPLSEVKKAMAFESEAGKVRCEHRPEEECISYEGIVWEASELVEMLGEKGEVVGHALVNNPEKLKAHEEKKMADAFQVYLRIEKKKEIRAKLKEFDKAKIKTLADAKEFLEDIAELLKEE